MCTAGIGSEVFKVKCRDIQYQCIDMLNGHWSWAKVLYKSFWHNMYWYRQVLKKPINTFLESPNILLSLQGVHRLPGNSNLIKPFPLRFLTFTIPGCRVAFITDVAFTINYFSYIHSYQHRQLQSDWNSIRGWNIQHFIVFTAWEQSRLYPLLPK